ncbi:AAA family ATPase [Shewanella sp. NKUCC05_KAH]|uniref:AAA family ATPase n=1 Tax=Shewanella sp. NKUCC05_KAH TaxID=2842126 RepID=UPI001C5BAE73|nr:AAA family ATPase [Shewanella sp. NKUCC05_KAH]MBW3527683.1 AAA family ATPase [Shewanella sp. NKUCC05_KAH]
MIFLTKVTIKGFKNDLTTVVVDFSNLQSSVIFGLNGCGKTTFLKILNAIFQQNETVLFEEGVESVFVEYKHKAEISDDWIFDSFRLERTETKISIDKSEYITSAAQIAGRRKVVKGKDSLQPQFDFERVEIKWNWNSYLDSKLAKGKSLSLGVDRGSQAARFTISTRLIVQFLSKIPELRRSVASLADIHRIADELVQYIRFHSSASIMSKSSNVVNFEDDHVFLKEINMTNIESTLLERYRIARRNTARKIQNALFDTLSSAISENSEFGPRKSVALYNEVIFKNKELLIEALDDKTENSFKDNIVSKLRMIKSESDLDSLRDNSLLSRLLMEMSNQLRDSEQELSAINTVIDKFNEFVRGENIKGGKELVVNQSSVKIKIGDTEHSISQLSSGERHILTLFTLLLEQGRHRDFIIIDEPEISLNSLWQIALLPTIEALLPYSQIIVASHSPLLAQSMDNLSELVVHKV